MADMELALQIRAEVQQAVRELRGTRQEMGRLGQGGKAAEEDLRGLNQRVEELQRGLDGVQRVGRAVRGVLGALGVGFSIRAVFQATIEQERVLAQLDARIRSTGGAAGYTRDELAKMAAELQQVTTYGDEAVMAMQGVLLTFTQVRGAEFRDATGLILDMATALGQDLQSAAMQVGRALNDPIQGITALNRAGVQFTQDQRELVRQLVETGDVAGAQRVILKELETQFAGSAKAARNTFGGALQALRNAIGDLFEAEGGGLISAKENIEDLTTMLSDPGLVSGLDDLTTGFIQLVSWIAKAGAEGGKFARWLGEELAARSSGAAAGDIVRIWQELDRIAKSIEGLNTQEQRFGSLAPTMQQELERLLKRRSELLRMEKEALDTSVTNERKAADDKSKTRQQDTQNLARNLDEQLKLQENHTKALAQARQQRKSLEGMADDLEAEFAPQAPTINAELENVLNTYRELPAAQRALKEGDFDGAIQGAQKLAERLRQAREEGQLSGPELARMSRELAKILREAGQGKEAEAEGVPLKLDTGSLQAAIDDGRAWIRWAFEEDKPKVPVELELDTHSLMDNLVIPGAEGEDVKIPAGLDTTPAAEDFYALSERLRSMVIRIPVEIDTSGVGGAGGEALQETISREAAKRGRRG